MSCLIKKHPLLTVLTLLMIAGLTVNLYAALTNTYDTSTPAGGDDPREADDRMREIKAAVQERMNDHNGEADEGDHYWPLTGTEVSNVDAGQHRMVTLKQTSANPSTLTSYATRTDLGWLFQKDVSGNGELFWEDEATNALQMTTGGLFNLSLGALWDGTFKTSTSDASDTKSITLASGGAYGVGRGAGIVMYGNEHATNPGQLILMAGYSSGSDKAVINASSSKIINVVDPEDAQDVATMAWVEARTPGFGDWSTTATLTAGGDETITVGHSYTAATDGFVACYGSSSSHAAGSIEGWTPVVTKRVGNGSGYADVHTSGFVMPVKKGDTWKITTTDFGTGTVTAFWIPMGV